MRSSRGLEPDPYIDHPDGPWHAAHFTNVVNSVRDLLAAYRSGLVTEQHLLRGKDNGRCKCGRDKTETLSYWLYFQHHPGSERWKILGQRFWSVEAWKAWRARFFSTPIGQRFSPRDGLPSLETIPKRKVSGEGALVSEHIVPKKALKRLLMSDQHPVEGILALNHCAVVTRAEDRQLAQSSHPDPFQPWSRYSGSGIQIIRNPAWTELEEVPLAQFVPIINPDDPRLTGV